MHPVDEKPERHAGALGVLRSPGSPYVTQTSTGLSITRVLLEDGEKDVADLPKVETSQRPAVYCPFCGRRGKYNKRRKKLDRLEFFSHGTGEDNCAETDLQESLHRRTIELIRCALKELREKGRALKGKLPCRRCKKQQQVILLEAGSWNDEAIESRLTTESGYRVPDIHCKSDDKSIFCIEVALSHYVDDARARDLEGTGIPGLELSTSEFFKRSGSPWWSYHDALPQPVRSWNLERAPSPYIICPNCRDKSPELLSLQRLIEGGARALSEAEVQRRVARQQRQLPSGTAPLHERLVWLVASPEQIRELEPELAERAANTPPEQLLACKQVALAALGWSSWRPWERQTLPEVVEAPFELVISEIWRAAQSVEELKRLRDRIQPLVEKAEQIVRWLGEPLHAGRVEAWTTIVTLEHAKKTGSTALKPQLLRQLVRKEISELNEPTGNLKDVVVLGLERKWLDICKQLVGLRGWGERASSELLFQRLRRRPQEVLDEDSPIQGPVPEQIQAIKVALRSSVFVLTGGPGTGKTTTLRELVKRWNGRCWLLAPTWKAVARLREVFAQDAQLVNVDTVAGFVLRTTGIAPDGTRKDGGDRHVADGALVIIDESSFLDSLALSRLLDGAGNAAKILFSGDVDQLPSIGPGAVFHSLVACQAIPTYSLSTIHRIGERRSLADFAAAVRQGRFREDIRKGVRFLPVSSEAATIERAVEQYCRAAEQFRENASDCVQVITPYNRCKDAINLRLQKMELIRDSVRRKYGRFRLGDKIICTEQIIGARIEKGEMGILASGDGGGIGLVQNGRYLPITPSMLEHFALAYAVTVHSAQGSEWEWVILAIPPRRSDFVDRQLLYTAVTRARAGLILIGPTDTIHRAAALDRSNRRESLLRGYLHDAKQSP